jgi:hypothetical protein
MYVRQTFTATASQTTFTITGGYTAYKLDVFQNGVKLVNSDVGISRDVDVSNGTTIVLATGAAVGDVIDVIGLTSGNFAGPATARRQNYTATAGQTTFTVSGGYTVGQLDVFQNGTKLVTAVDVDVSNGSTFTLTTPAVAGDSLEVVGFTAADTVSGTLQFQAGTAAVPSITTFGDTNTGLFFPAADTIAFSEGGVESMRIDASGNLGIGTNNPSTPSGKCITIYDSNIPRLNLKNSTSGDTSTDGVELYLTGSDAYLNNRENGSISIGTNNATKLLIDSSGQVGIGTTSPSDILHVSKVNGVSIFESTGVSSVGIRLRTNSTDRWQIGCPNASSDLAIYTGAAATERFRIDSSGRVGIGTNSPEYPLVVSSAVSTQIQIRAGNANASSILFGDTDSAAIGRIQYDHGTDSMAMWTNSAERLRISSNGTILLAKDTAAIATVGYRFDTNGEIYTSHAASTSAGGTYYIYSTGAAAYRFYVGLGGTVNATNTAIAAISDVRLKENIRDIDAGLNKILELKPRTFDWKEGKGANTKNARGFIAQEIEQVFPDLVDEWRDPAPEGEEPYKSVRQDLIPVLVKAIQELSAKVTALEAA